MQEATAKPSDMTVLNHELFEVEGASKRLYTISELIRLTGITRRQFDYWAQTNLLSPVLRESKARGRNPASFYSAEEAIRALIFGELKRRGFTPCQIKQVANNLKKDRVRLEKFGTYLLTDGYSVYYANNDREAVDILKHHRQMLLLVPIHEQVKKLKEAA